MTLTAPPSDFKTTKPMYKPYKSSNAKKKGMVYVSSNGAKKLIHFGDANMKDFTDSSMQSFDQHKDPARRKNYLARSAGIKDKQGNLTAKNKNSANYWARKMLW